MVWFGFVFLILLYVFCFLFLILLGLITGDGITVTTNGDTANPLPVNFDSGNGLFANAQRDVKITAAVTLDGTNLCIERQCRTVCMHVKIIHFHVKMCYVSVLCGWKGTRECGIEAHMEIFVVLFRRKRALACPCVPTLEGMHISIRSFPYAKLHTHAHADGSTVFAATIAGGITFSGGSDSAAAVSMSANRDINIKSQSDEVIGDDFMAKMSYMHTNIRIFRFVWM